MNFKRPTFSRAVELVADVAAGAACGGILIIVLVQVTGRLLGRPLPWTEEAVRFLFIWMVFLGLAAGFRTVESARVVVFMAMARKLFRHIAVPIYVGSSVLFFLITGWTGITLVRQQIMMNEVAATLPLPMWIIGLVMPVSSAVAILAIIDSLRTRRDLIALPEPGLPPGELAYADVNMTAGAQP
jgi:C4-dicarboxylate transporter DctQ subunit